MNKQQISLSKIGASFWEHYTSRVKLTRVCVCALGLRMAFRTHTDGLQHNVTNNKNGRKIHSQHEMRSDPGLFLSTLNALHFLKDEIQFSNRT